jgi:hypothetical protein
MSLIHCLADGDLRLRVASVVLLLLRVSPPRCYSTNIPLPGHGQAHATGAGILLVTDEATAKSAHPMPPVSEPPRARFPPANGRASPQNDRAGTWRPNPLLRVMFLCKASLPSAVVNQVAVDLTPGAYCYSPPTDLVRPAGVHVRISE